MQDVHIGKTARELIEVHNARGAPGDRIEEWKASKGKLIAMIEAMPDAEAAESPETKPEDEPAPETIGQMVKRLVAETDLDYGAIVKEVRSAHPEARTTRRSVASVACMLRKTGVEVPKRHGRMAANEGGET